MKKLTLAWASALAIVIVMAGSGVIPMVGIVTAAIPVPHNNWGHPYDETGVQMNVPELITSWIDGVEYGRNDTFLFSAEVWYDIDTAGNWVTAPGDPNSPWVKEGGDLGEPIMFAWGDMTNIKLDPDSDNILDYGIFEEYDLWWTTAVNQTDIHLAALADQPPIFPKISWIVPEPTDGYPDYLLIYTEDPFFDMSDFYLQKNDGNLSGPTQALSGVSNSTAYFYANLTNPAMDLQGCGDEIKLVWTNPGPAFGGMDIVVDRVEWNATVGGCHFTEPDNTIMTDATAPATGFAIRRTGTFPVFADDTNDNAADFVSDTPWPRPVIGAPVVTWVTPAGGESWTGNWNHTISFILADANAVNNQITLWVNYSLTGMAPWFPATLNITQPFTGWYDAVTAMDLVWLAPFANETTVVLEVCAVNPAGKSNCYDSNTFELDSTPPAVTTTDPLDASTDVPVNLPILITFSEDMGTTNATIDPNPGGIVLTNPTPDTLRVDHNDFVQDTDYCVFVNGTDDSVPGNPLPTYTFCFHTYLVTMPWIDLTAPVGGEIWTGGSSHDITWGMGDNGTMGAFVWLNYSCGATVYAIDEGLMSDPRWTQPYSWGVPLLDAVDCFIIATIQDFDDHLVASDTTPQFTIDSTIPMISGTTPMDLELDVAVDTTVVITFSEAMDTASTEAAFSLVDSATSTSVTGTFAWSSGDTVMTFTPDNPLEGATEYCFTVGGTAKDISDPGNFLSGEDTFCFTTIVTNTPPTVTVSVPAVGTLWAGGSVELIEWTMTDDGGVENLTVDVSYSYNNVTTPIATGLSGALNYSWTVACPAGADADASDVVIFVEATDTGGLSGNGTSGAFTIDCTDPTGTIAWTGEEKEGEVLNFRIDNPSESIASYLWDFGDGTTGITGATPTHIYEDGDTYSISCTLTDQAGNTNTVSATIDIEKVAPPPSILADYWWIILIIIIVIILLLVVAAKRRKPEEEEVPPEEEEVEEEEVEEEIPEEEEYEEEEVAEEETAETPEEEGGVPEAAPAAPAEEAAPAREEPARERRECPSCGTVVPADATECFLCGAKL